MSLIIRLGTWDWTADVIMCDWEKVKPEREEERERQRQEEKGKKDRK